jgi:ligand-binding sensor domain-containing protein/signal transduction histidine kinase
MTQSFLSYRGGLPLRAMVGKDRPVSFRVVLLVSLLLTVPLSARAEQLPVKTYTIADGLAHDEIRKIFQDSHGFLWFCTTDGLSRFDGYRFITYTAKNGLAFSYITDMLESRSGVYWISTNGGGVSRFDPSASARAGVSALPEADALFITYRVSDDSNANKVNTVYEDHSGNIWAGTDNGLFRLDGGNVGGTFQQVELGIRTRPDQVLEVEAIVEDAEDSLWVGIGQGLVRITPDARTIHYPLNPEQSVDYVWSLFRDKDGRVWAGHQSGLLVFEPGPAAQARAGDDFSRRVQIKKQAGHAQPPQTTSLSLPASPGEARWYTVADGLSHNNVHALYQSADGRMWIGTVGGGLNVFDGERFRNYRAAQGLSNKIEALAEDRDGNLWVGTQASGAMKIARSGLLSYGEMDGLGNPEIVSIFESRASELIVISSKWTVNRFDGERFVAARLNLPQKILDSSSGRWVIIQDHTGEWWAATNQGLYRFPNVNRIEDLARVRPVAAYTTREGLADNYISRLFEDSHGDIWIGTFNPPETLTRWERATETFHRYSETDGIPPLNWANVFAEDHAGNLWIGLHNGGMMRYRNNRFETFGEAEGVPIGLTSGLYFDRAGKLWLAVRARETGRIDDPTGEHPRAAAFIASEKLSSESLWCFTEDDWGNIYVGTARGIDRLNPATSQIKHFTTADGLIKSEVTKAFRDSSGALWFGTPEGLSRLIPEKERATSPPPVLISGLRIAGVAYPISELGTTEVSGLELGADQHQIEIDFFGLSFSAGESLHYQYMIEGVDRDWSAPTDQRTITANVRPGSYRFLVRAISADGDVTDKPAVISFTIFPPIWQRWWFLTLVALLVSALAYTLYRYRVAQLLKLERVRTRIATDLHDDIGASLSQIAILSEVISQRVGKEASPVTEPLSMIAGTSREMVDAMSDIVWAINPKRDHLSDLSQRMRRFASDILSARDIRFSFHAPDAEKKLRLGTDLRREVYLIFKESVNNMVKHANCTEADLLFQIEHGWLTVKVSDNGEGFDVDAATNGDHQGMGGHGLASMQKRAEAMGGSYKIESKKKQGTTVTLHVPLTGRRAKKAHSKKSTT